MYEQIPEEDFTIIRNIQQLVNDTQQQHSQQAQRYTPQTGNLQSSTCLERVNNIMKRWHETISTQAQLLSTLFDLLLSPTLCKPTSTTLAENKLKLATSIRMLTQVEADVIQNIIWRVGKPTRQFLLVHNNNIIDAVMRAYNNERLAELGVDQVSFITHRETDQKSNNYETKLSYYKMSTKQLNIMKYQMHVNHLKSIQGCEVQNSRSWELSKYTRKIFAAEYKNNIVGVKLGLCDVVNNNTTVMQQHNHQQQQQVKDEREDARMVNYITSTTQTAAECVVQDAGSRLIDCWRQVNILKLNNADNNILETANKQKKSYENIIRFMKEDIQTPLQCIWQTCPLPEYEYNNNLFKSSTPAWINKHDIYHYTAYVREQELELWQELNSLVSKPSSQYADMYIHGSNGVGKSLAVWNWCIKYCNEHEHVMIVRERNVGDIRSLLIICSGCDTVYYMNYFPASAGHEAVDYINSQRKLHNISKLIHIIDGVGGNIPVESFITTSELTTECCVVVASGYIDVFSYYKKTPYRPQELLYPSWTFDDCVDAMYNDEFRDYVMKQWCCDCIITSTISLYSSHDVCAITSSSGCDQWWYQQLVHHYCVGGGLVGVTLSMSLTQSYKHVEQLMDEFTSYYHYKDDPCYMYKQCNDSIEQYKVVLLSSNQPVQLSQYMYNLADDKGDEMLDYLLMCIQSIQRFINISSSRLDTKHMD